jgi:hypothetical protein
MPNAQRVVHLTFHKCGSQWVRDVLTDPEIVALNGIPMERAGVNLFVEPWPAQNPGTFIGPIYNASSKLWSANRGSEDRAIIVLRDPRDRLVSWVISMAYSHGLDPFTLEIFRELFVELDAQKRLLLGLYELRRVSDLLYSWANYESTGQDYITTYEKLSMDELGEFRRIVTFLGWNIPESTLAAVVHRHSFFERSGRERGHTNIHSHFRRGVPGDWRNHFDRGLGRAFEMLFPNLLLELGYETTRNWFEGLPEHINQAQSGIRAEREYHILKADFVRLAESKELLQKDLRIMTDELEKRAAALNAMDAEMNLLRNVCSEREALIMRQDQMLKDLQKAAMDRPPT